MTLEKLFGCSDDVLTLTKEDREQLLEQYNKETCELRGNIRSLESKITDMSIKQETIEDEFVDKIESAIGCITSVREMLGCSKTYPHDKITHAMRNFYCEAMIAYISNTIAHLKTFSLIEKLPF